MIPSISNVCPDLLHRKPSTHRWLSHLNFAHFSYKHCSEVCVWWRNSLTVFYWVQSEVHRWIPNATSCALSGYSSEVPDFWLEIWIGRSRRLPLKQCIYPEFFKIISSKYGSVLSALCILEFFNLKKSFHQFMSILLKQELNASELLRTLQRSCMDKLSAIIPPENN